MRFDFPLYISKSGIFITYNIHLAESHRARYPKCRSHWPMPSITPTQTSTRKVPPIDRTPIGVNSSSILRRTPHSGRSLVRFRRYTGRLERHCPVNTWDGWWGRGTRPGGLGRLSPPSGCLRVILGNTPLKTSQNTNKSLQDPAPRPILRQLAGTSGKWSLRLSYVEREKKVPKRERETSLLRAL